MSTFFRCDYCNARVTGSYSSDDDRWYPPREWRSFTLDDWQVHGCTQQHLDLAKEQSNELTPLSESTKGVPLP